MDWEQTTDSDELTEWTRADGNATIRRRERTGGDFAVRYDQLYQAAGGREYAYEIVETRADADELVADWQANTPVGDSE